ncbi:MEIOTIC F-BOX protein MOF-like [Lolium rigidum]|uniref:MEIOTIC F-BOX protein MOF-like n=1 Tax=Lolium rigidum TaxID=89674 RepID=UPI001F5D1898|nr:MEIOTIC F-BOX protein MOF-like [Lolium rigidum]
MVGETSEVEKTEEVHPPILVFLATGSIGGQERAVDARHLFDGMPPRKERKSAPPVSGVDRIGALPDSILHHLLSFLPAQAAVRTCVLARRWHHLWRSTTGLRIVALDDDYYADVEELRKFVDHLLILRERTDLDSVEIEFYGFCEEDQPYVKTWLRYALMCKVRTLTLSVGGSKYFFLEDLPLVSRHLGTLDLDGVGLKAAFLDFANCPVLENLKMTSCHICAGNISSRSMKHLSITSCSSELDCRVRVSTPGLISLKLVEFSGRTPLLENMALLETAYVDLGQNYKDVCLNYQSGVSCGANNNACENCVAIKDNCSSDCVVLGGISSAKHLQLLSKSGNFIFARDLKHCPTFTKLKTLLLNGYWCKGRDLDPLACILKNSPVLEKLTLQLFSTGSNHKVVMKGSYSSMERPAAISEHLNIVEVKCNVVDEKILKVLKFLTSFNIRFGFL